MISLTERLDMRLQSFGIDVLMVNIINAEGGYNVTVINANAEAMKKMLEANGTATSIRLVTQQLTPQYATYLWLMQWDGRLPLFMGGEGANLLIDVTELMNQTRTP